MLTNNSTVVFIALSHRIISYIDTRVVLCSVTSSVTVPSGTVTSTNNLVHLTSSNVLRSAGVFLLVPSRATCPASRVRL